MEGTAKPFHFHSLHFALPLRIKDAEKAIVARGRELFGADADTIEEDRALDDALYALPALLSYLRFRVAA